MKFKIFVCLLALIPFLIIIARIIIELFKLKKLEIELRKDYEAQLKEDIESYNRSRF